MRSVILVLALLTPVLSLSDGSASASTPCTSTTQIARIPRYQGGGYWRAEMSCTNQRSGRAGDVNIGHRQLTGQVCLVTMRYGYPLYTLACGWSFNATAYVNSFIDVATQVWLQVGGYVMSGTVRT